jgi:hypothetical protein
MVKPGYILLICFTLMFVCYGAPASARLKRLKALTSHNTTIQYPEGKAWALQFDFNWMQYNVWQYQSSPIVDIFSNELGDPLPKCRSIMRNEGAAPKIDFLAEYDQQGKMTSYVNNSYGGDSIVSFTKYLFTYDFPGRLIMIREVSLKDAVLDTTAMKLLFYDNQNQLLGDSSVFWTADSITRTVIRSYSYNSYGILRQVSYRNLFSSYPPSTSRYDFYCDGSGRLRAVDRFVNGDLSDTDSFNYTGDIRYFTSYGSYGYREGKPQLGLRITKHIGPNGLPDTLVRTIEGVIRVVEIYAYDSLGNVGTVHSKDYNGQNVLTGEHAYGYIYEDVPDSIYTIIAQTEIAAYPNPVSDDLTVAWRNGILGSIYSIQLYNASGQNVLSRTINWNGQLESISVRSFPVGQYILKVEGGAAPGRIVQKVLKL